MPILTFIVAIGLVGGALVLVLQPLWRKSRPGPATSTAGYTFDELEARYNAILASIKDLMFDYEMGKMSHEDYEVILVESKTEAARIRKEMDRLADHTALDPTIGAEIEALVTTARKNNRNGSRKMLQEIDQNIAQLKNGNGHTTACSHCYGRVRIGDAFCPCCGHSLNGSQAATADHHRSNQCSECGALIQPADAFCASCGAALTPMLNPSQLDNIAAI
jgi:hypothetical protein